MRVSFDLDGVIAEGHHSIFGLLHLAEKTDAELASSAELTYYSSRPLKYHPSAFLAPGDDGFIITARKPKAEEITRDWLRGHRIALPVVFVDGTDEVDWSDYATASEKVAHLKGKVIRELGVEVHFDNNPIIIDVLRRAFLVKVVSVQ